MDIDSRNLSRLICAFGRKLASLTSEQLDAVMKGDFQIVTSNDPTAVRHRTSTTIARGSQGVDDQDIMEIKERLEKLTDMDEGAMILERELPLKGQLVRLAKVVEVAVSKGMDLATVKNRILAQTIGHRLNRDVIRNAPSVQASPVIPHLVGDSQNLVADSQKPHDLSTVNNPERPLIDAGDMRNISTDDQNKF